MCPHSTIFRCVNFRCECNRPVYSVYALVKRSLVTWRMPGALPICHSTRAAVNAGSCFVSPVKDSASHRSVHWEGAMLSTGKKL